MPHPPPSNPRKYPTIAEVQRDLLAHVDDLVGKSREEIEGIVFRIVRGHIENFEDLEIWPSARARVKEIYMDFEEVRDRGFCDQIRRAALSVMNNIAEGYERDTDPEFARMLKIAKGSCGEVRSMYYAAEDLDYVDPRRAIEKRGQAKLLSRRIAALVRHLRRPP